MTNLELLRGLEGGLEGERKTKYVKLKFSRLNAEHSAYYFSNTVMV